MKLFAEGVDPRIDRAGGRDFVKFVPQAMKICENVQTPEAQRIIKCFMRTLGLCEFRPSSDFDLGVAFRLMEKAFEKPAILSIMLQGKAKDLLFQLFDLLTKCRDSGRGSNVRELDWLWRVLGGLFGGRLFTVEVWTSRDLVDRGGEEIGPFVQLVEGN